MFKGLADKLLRIQLMKGVPPLFVNMRSLYNDPEKVKILEDLIVGYAECLKANKTFAKDGKCNANACIVKMHSGT